jgi:hypothetical protein
LVILMSKFFFYVFAYTIDLDQHLHLMVNFIREMRDIKWKPSLKLCRIGLDKDHRGLRFFIAQLRCMLWVISTNTNNFHKK